MDPIYETPIAGPSTLEDELTTLSPISVSLPPGVPVLKAENSLELHAVIIELVMVIS
jgi:hypothetical protein